MLSFQRPFALNSYPCKLVAFQKPLLKQGNESIVIESLRFA
ncbi:hypothetical protein HMPREF1404_01362 [Helicobacter pylori GAM210Bi]|nr:hypothetical protein HMPREF1404_01362 [Helicobacter pylori GAM210Bi]